MYLREYLYADLDRIRSLAGQLMEGVPEEARTTEKKVKQLALGMKGVAGSSSDWSSEEYVNKSLVDSLFGSLEDILESDGWLNDISEELQSGTKGFMDLAEEFPPGSLVRITSPGILFDARFVARVLSGVAAAADGITIITKAKEKEEGHAHRKRIPQAGKYKNRPRETKPPMADTLEAGIEDYDTEYLGIDPAYLRAMIKLARGVFAPGVHLLLTPNEDRDLVATARLEEGRKYLESDAEVLFSRYGTARQNWTLVGSIGTYGEKTNPDRIKESVWMNPDGRTLNRSKMAGYVNYFMQFVGHQGLADIPQFSSFSIVPLAVYRTITRKRSSEITRDDGAVV